MYFLVLIAMLQMHDFAPKFIAPPTTLEACTIEAAERNEKDGRIRNESVKELGLRYACLTFAPST